MNKKQSKRGYMIQLDSLRFFAITLVTIEHWLYNSFINKILPTGFLGVRLFFVLSGFLITLIILKGRNKLSPSYRKRNFWKSFYIRRFLRIFPIYYISLIILFIFNIGNVQELLGWHLTYTSNIFYFFNQGLKGIESHFWTLSIEEQFYIIWPLLLLITPNKYLFKTICSFVVIGLLSRIVLLYLEYDYILTFPLATFDSFGIGGIIAYIFYFKEDKISSFLSWKKNIIWSINLLLFIIVLLLPLPYDRTIWIWKVLLPLVSSVFFAWFIVKAAIGFNGVLKIILEFRLFVYLGKISYGFYIFHIFVGYLLLKNIQYELDNITIYVLYYISTIIIASLSWFIIEKPINNFKRRFSY